MVFFGSISNPFSTLIFFFFPNQKHLCPHLHIFNLNICVSQNDKVRQKENETTYLDPEAQTCPALVPVSNSVVPEAQTCPALVPVSNSVVPEAQTCPALASVLASLSPILGLCLGGLFLRRQHPPPSCWYLTNYIDSIVSVDLS